MVFDLQKASFLKRVSAFILDLIVLGILATGFAYLISEITGFDARTAELQAYYTEYEERYGVDFDLSSEDYEALTKEERQRLTEAEAALSQDPDAMRLYSLIVSLTILISSIGLFLAFLCAEFILPLLMKDGQTVGKKIFGIGVMSTTGVRITPVALFVRTVLGKYTLETMIPVFIAMMIFFGMIGILGTLILLALLVLQISMMIATNTNSTIHDLLAGTVVIDTSSQMIFASQEELLEHKKAKAAENASQSKY